MTEDAFLGIVFKYFNPRGLSRPVSTPCFLPHLCRMHLPISLSWIVARGVGTVGLCVAARCESARVTLVEREQPLLSLARENSLRNGFQVRVSVCLGDVTVAAQVLIAPALPAETFDHVLAIPPTMTRAAERMPTIH